jgi:two-component system phosphate regulon sensor histidine kinase PhoR
MPSKQNNPTRFPWLIYIKLAKFHSLVLTIALVGLFILFREHFKSFSELHITIESQRTALLKYVPLVILIYLLALWILIKTDQHIGKVMAKISDLSDGFNLSEGLKLTNQTDEWTKIEKTLEKAEEAIQEQYNELEIEHEKVKGILSTISDAILALDKRFQLLFFNEQFKNLEVISSEYFQGSHQRNLRHAFFDPELTEAYHQCLYFGNTSILKEYKIVHNHKETSFVDITIKPLKDHKGDIVGALGVFHDVTEHKLAEQMRVDFVANISHEVRTPLTSIKGYTQLLKGNKNQIPLELHEYIDRILNNSEHVINLFNDLLSLSVIESHSKIQMEEFDLRQAIESIVQNCETITLKKQIQVELALVDHPLTANRRLLEQVITNLIDNSVRYCPEKSIIKISSFIHDQVYRIEVSDNGPGIAKEHQKRIFERFFRVDNSRELHEKGTGIGLSLVKHIIQKHHGLIWVDSELGHGSTFIIEIPLNLKS